MGEERGEPMIYSCKELFLSVTPFSPVLLRWNALGLVTGLPLAGRIEACLQSGAETWQLKNPTLLHSFIPFK